MSRLLLPSLPLRPRSLTSAGPCRVCRPPSTPPRFPRSRSHSQAQRGPAPNGPAPNLRASVMEYTATRVSLAATAGKVLVPVADANEQEAVASSSASSAMGKAAKKENKGVKSKHNIAKQQKKAAKKSGAGGPGPEPPSSPARQPPSRASGGVPDPTPAYLDQALGKPRALPRPRRLLVVLDLNGTMLHRPSKRRPFHFVERPHAQRFLAYCLDNFHLAIWSSARPANVARMVEKLLTPEQVRRCLLVWARDRFRLSPQDYDARVQVYKRLTRVWDDPAVRASASAPSAARWDQSNTVLVDDSREKGRSEPYNILPLPEFSGLENETAEVLPQVHDYLNALCWQADVSRYIRETPFQLDPNYRLSNQ